MHIAKQAGRGSVVLFSGNLLATAIAAVASIVVARLLGPSNFGLFTLSLVTPSLLQLFTHFGTRTAVTRYVAHHLALGEVEMARRFAQSAMIFSLLVGGLLAGVNYAASWWVAGTLFQRPDLQPYIALASAFLIGQSIVLNVIAIATGWNAMGQASFANILQSILKLAISPALILLGFSISGAVLGHLVSYVVGGTVSAFILFFTKVKLVRERLGYFIEDTKEMIRFGFQPFIGGLLGGLATFYVSVLLAAVTVGHNELVGYYSAATNLTVPLSLLAGATGAALYPAFTSLHGIKADTGQAFAMSLKYVAFLIGPVIFFLVAASNELMYTFYGNSYVAGSGYLVLLSLASAPIILGQSVFASFFLGLGRPRLAFVTGGLAAVVLFVVAPLLSVSSGLGVYGLILALLLSNGTTAAVGLYLVHHYGMGAAGWGSLSGTVVASLVALGACLILPATGHDIIMLGVKMVLFGGVYLTLAPLLRAVDVGDVDRIGESLHEVPLVGTLVSPFLKYERALAGWGRNQVK
jgi:O-antigen/teichoic acid export membrane protein